MPTCLALPRAVHIHFVRMRNEHPFSCAPSLTWGKGAEKSVIESTPTQDIHVRVTVIPC